MKIAALAFAFLTFGPRHLRRDRLWLNIVIIKIPPHYDVFRNQLRGWSIVHVNKISKGIERNVL